MKRIASFCVNHELLNPGLDVSRIDYVHDYPVTTFDMRCVKPNTDGILDTDGLHAFEHLGATYLRNSSWKDRIIYFGPMGCRTGFYIIISGDVKPLDIYDLMKDFMNFVLDFTGKVPGASSIECGNYRDINLDKAKEIARKYKEEVLDNFNESKYIYPVSE